MSLTWNPQVFNLYVDELQNDQLTLRFYCRRRGHSDTYRLRITDTGWWVGHIAIRGHCNSRGEPYLFENLDHDTVNYPHDLGGYMDFLWRQVKHQKLNRQQIQAKLNILGRWMTKVETATPKGIWEAHE